MLGGRFQVYNRSDLSDTVNIYTVTQSPFYKQSIKIENAPFSRYAVYQFGGLPRGDIAEMELWELDGNGKEVKLEGKIIGNPGTYGSEKENAMDSDRVTYFYAEKNKKTYIGYRANAS